MWRYVLHKLVAAIPVLLGTTLLAFLILRLVGGGVSGVRHHAHGPGVQPDRRRPARRTRSAAAPDLSCVSQPLTSVMFAFRTGVCHTRGTRTLQRRQGGTRPPLLASRYHASEERPVTREPCRGCGAPRPRLAVEQGDEFCSTECARRHYGTSTRDRARVAIAPRRSPAPGAFWRKASGFSHRRDHR